MRVKSTPSCRRTWTSVPAAAAATNSRGSPGSQRSNRDGWWVANTLPTSHCIEKGEPMLDVDSAPTTRTLIRHVILAHWPKTAGILLFAALTALGTIVQPLLTREIVDGAFARANLGLLVKLCLYMLCIAVGTIAVNAAQSQISIRWGSRVSSELTSALYLRFARRPLADFTLMRTGEVQSRLLNDVAMLRGNLIVGSQRMVGSTAMLVGGGAATLLLDWRIGLMVAVVLPFQLISARKLSRRRRRLATQLSEATADLSSTVADALSLGGVTLSRTIDSEAYFRVQFTSHLERARTLF